MRRPVKGPSNLKSGDRGTTHSPVARKRQGMREPARATLATLAPWKWSRKRGRKTPKALHIPSTSALPRKLEATITQPYPPSGGRGRILLLSPIALDSLKMLHRLKQRRTLDCCSFIFVELLFPFGGVLCKVCQAKRYTFDLSQLKCALLHRVDFNTHELTHEFGRNPF